MPTLGNVLNANSNKITNLTNGSNAQDAVTFSQLASTVVGVMDIIGPLDASTNPNYPVGVKGNAYVISVAGLVGGGAGTAVSIGDLVVCLNNNAGGTQAAVGADWFILEMNLQQATESRAGYAEIATQVETDAGVDDTRFVTPLKLANYPVNVSGAISFLEEPASDPDNYVQYVVESSANAVPIVETTVDLSAFVPVGTKGVILWTYIASNTATTGRVTLYAYPANLVYGGMSLIGNMTANTIVETATMFVQLNNSRQFKYYTEASGVNGIYEITMVLIGYF